jgi:hypothetical protein
VKGSLRIEERPEDWTLIIEPWALALDIPASKRVIVELFDVGRDEEFSIDLALNGSFLAFDEDHFNVRIGDDAHEFDFRTLQERGESSGV